MATSVLRDWCLLAAEKALLIRNDLASMLLQRLMPRLVQLMLSYGPPRQGDSFWADEENAGWAEIRIRYRGASVIRQWLGQQPASLFAVGIQQLVDKWNKCLNELGQYVEK